MSKRKTTEKSTIEPTSNEMIEMFQHNKKELALWLLCIFTQHQEGNWASVGVSNFLVERIAMFCPDRDRLMLNMAQAVLRTVIERSNDGEASKH